MKRDTLALYKKIKKVAYKHKVTEFLYHSIFVDPAPQSYEIKSLSDQQKKKDPNLKFQRKIIRRITIEVFDPFGYSVNDTTKIDVHALQKLGNRYHITTRHKIIRNILLFKQNDELDLLKINESERLIRNTPYVNDARIYIAKTENKNSDSVDIKVVVKDKWSLDAWGDLSPSQGNITIRENNIAGFGQKYQQHISREFNGIYEISGNHNVANISKSFISSNIFYKTKKDYLQTGISLDRPFYSSFTKWAGGVSVIQTQDIYSYTDTIEKIPHSLPLNSISSDAWIARSIKVGKRKPGNGIHNIILSARNAETHFFQRPDFSIDTGKLNVNTRLYLGSVGFSLSKYYKDQYIFRFGANEDIPEGFIVQFLYGLYYKEENGTLYYSGFDISNGKHFDNLGYFSARASYGNLFSKSMPDNKTINLGLTYFTDLLRGGKWYYRQFAYLKYVNGINKPVTEKIILRPDELYGFSSSPAGKSKLLLNLEGVTYSPYNIIGFKFAPVVLIGFGMIETDYSKLFTGHIYQSYALGLLIRNENLIISSFEVTFGFYPGENQYYKYNPVTRFTVQFRSFSILKPVLVAYE